MQIKAPFSANIAAADTTSAVELHVVLAYESLAAALRAADAIACLSRRDPEGLTVRLSLWSFAALENPLWQVLAAPEVERAELIVLASCNPSQRLSLNLEHWLKACLARRHEVRYAVAAIFGRDDGPDRANSPRLQSVRRLAREAGCAFFAPRAGREFECVG